MEKTLHFTNGKKSADIEIRLVDGRLSICGTCYTGKELFKSERNLISCGQCVDECSDLIPEQLAEAWKRWHLNDMRAGCEHQRAEKWEERPIDPSKPLNSYGKHFDGQQSDSWNMLSCVPYNKHPEGLLGKPCPVCGYKYGTAWLKEELPQDVIAYLESL